MVTIVGRCYKINLYKLSSFKYRDSLLPTRFDLKLKYVIFLEFPKMGQGGPLCLNPEGAIPIKLDVVEKNKNCYIPHSMPKNSLKLIFGYVVP